MPWHKWHYWLVQHCRYNLPRSCKSISLLYDNAVNAITLTAFPKDRLLVVLDPKVLTKQAQSLLCSFQPITIGIYESATHAY